MNTANGLLLEMLSVLENVAPASVGFVANTSAPLPVSSEITLANCADVVAANCASVPVVSANVVPHVIPVPLVYFSALFDVLQLGIANAVGLALDPVAFARIVFAAIAAMPLTPIPPHAGELDEPVETIAWPADEPAGFSNWTGV
ncbi:hypothetical protein WT25_10865 [Burkholderia territorii]|nr:hypothetical protein WT25_10865 [Burkholderia territorii]